MNISLDFNLSDIETYKDEDGILRHFRNNSVVVWHNKAKIKGVIVECSRTNIKPEAIQYDSFGNPWCPTCYAENKANDNIDRLGEFRSEPASKRS